MWGAKKEENLKGIRSDTYIFLCLFFRDLYMCEGIGTFFLTWVLMDLDMATFFLLLGSWVVGNWEGFDQFCIFCKKGKGNGGTLICGGTGGRKVFLFPSTFGWLAAVVVIKRKKKALLFPPFSPLFYRSWKFGEWKRYKKFGKPCQGQNLENSRTSVCGGISLSYFLGFVSPFAIPRSRKELFWHIPLYGNAIQKYSSMHAPFSLKMRGGILRNFSRSSIPRGYWEESGGIWR